jgi:crotonobetainyl-CoA:carnitine CoA-transferase CaiB-like acyl-CoA transferase
VTLPEESAHGALAGLRVLDISTFLSAPQIAAILGDFGAEVIKLEPPRGEPLRFIGAQRNGGSLMWAMASRNKRAITLDLDAEAGREILKQLIAHVDVLVENFPIETLAKWGCTWEDLRAINSRLVMVSVSCYGRTGPLSDRPGAGTLAEAFGGLTHMTGEADGPPMLPSIPLGDTLTAMVGVLGALAACYHRDAVPAELGGGAGQHVDVSMYEPILTLVQPTIIAYDPASDDPPPMRTGSRVPGGVPRNIYRTGDGRYLVVSGTTDRQVARVLKIIGADDDVSLSKFARSTDRLRHADELDALVAEWIARHDHDDVIAVLEANRVPVAPVHDVPGLLADPHMAARGDFVTVTDPTIGPITMVSPSPVLSDTPGTIRWAGPAIGAHNAEVYGELLGLDATALDDLRNRGLL